MFSMVDDREMRQTKEQALILQYNEYAKGKVERVNGGHKNI